MQVYCRHSVCDHPDLFLPSSRTFWHVTQYNQHCKQCIIKNLLQRCFTNLCLLVIFTPCQYDIKNSMRSATLCIHVGGRNCSGLIAFNHQRLYILKKEHKRISLGNRFFFYQTLKSKLLTETNTTLYAIFSISAN